MGLRTQKYILRKRAEWVGVPQRILARPKQGFALQLVHWIRNELKQMLNILLEPVTLQRDTSNGKRVWADVRRALSKPLRPSCPTLAHAHFRIVTSDFQKKIAR